MNSQVVENEMLAFFPNGVRVLLVDEDSMFLKTATMMLSEMQYKVATCSSPSSAMKFLSSDKVKDLDVLLVDAHQVANCGFDLRTIVETDLNIPVIYFMSPVGSSAAAGDAQSNIHLARVVQSATYIIRKPLNADEVSSLWRTVASRKCVLEEARKSKNCTSLLDRINNVETEEVQFNVVKASSGSRQRMNNRSGGDDDTDGSAGSCESYSQRVIWTPSLKKKFENALKIVGTGGHPNEILGQMNVKGLKRHHVASHLQKYRAKLDKKKNGCGGTAPSPCSSADNLPKERPIFRSFLPTANPKLFFAGGDEPSNPIDIDADEEFTGENDATAVMPSPWAQHAPLNSATTDTPAPALPLPTDQQQLSSSFLMETPNIAAMAFGDGNDAPTALSSWSPSLLFAVDDDVSNTNTVPVAMQVADQHQLPPSSVADFTGSAAPALLPWDASAPALLPWEQHEQVMVDAAAQEKEVAAMVDEMLAASNNTNDIDVPSYDNGDQGATNTGPNGTITLSQLEAFLLQDIPITDTTADADGPSTTGNGDEGGSGTRDWDPFL